MSKMPPSNSEKGRTKKRRWLTAFGGSSLLVSILLHTLFAVVAGYLIVEHFQKKHVNFHASAPPEEHTEVEHKVQMAKQNDVASAPPDLKRIVTTATSPISLPDVPPVPPDKDVTPTTMTGVDGVMDAGPGAGLSGAGSIGNDSGGGGPMTVFGAEGGTGLQGTLYDFKQTPNGKPTGMDPGTYHNKLRDFIAADWSPSLFSDYYKSPKILATPSIFIPVIDAKDGPKAFGVEKEVQPDMYAVWYKVTAAPTQDGTYHFVGVGDDILAVRLNGKTVLDGSLDAIDPELRAKETKINMTGFTPTCLPDSDFWIGTPFHGTAGEAMDIDVLISEVPGGKSDYFLFIQREESIYHTQSNGAPLLPVFQVDQRRVQPMGNGGTYPPFANVPEPWEVVGK